MERRVGFVGKISVKFAENLEPQSSDVLPLAIEFACRFA